MQHSHNKYFYNFDKAIGEVALTAFDALDSRNGVLTVLSSTLIILNNSSFHAWGLLCWFCSFAVLYASSTNDTVWLEDAKR